MKRIKIIVIKISENIWNSILHKEGYKNREEFLLEYKNNDDKFLFI
ncbi:MULTISPECIES: hypothetical protein [Aquimarina]|nr:MULTISPECIES: hypothetical protein [Aquimarina]